MREKAIFQKVMLQNCLMHMFCICIFSGIRRVEKRNCTVEKEVWFLPWFTSSKWNDCSH